MVTSIQLTRKKPVSSAKEQGGMTGLILKKQ
jgi:hypothetical protein